MTDDADPNTFQQPDWQPQVPAGMRVLVAGASGGIGQALVQMLHHSSDCVIGAHGSSRPCPVHGSNISHLQKTLETEDQCADLVRAFVAQAGGIDALVVLTGGIEVSEHWLTLPNTEWEAQIGGHLSVPFFLSRAAMIEMQKQGTGGRIVLNGTESSLHGGSPSSLAYACAKRGTECLVQGLAREGAPTNILVNGIRLGFIASGFHERWQGKTSDDIAKRTAMIPVNRAGHPAEVAAMIIYLLSGWGGFVTGQMIPLTGGDWL